MEIIISLVWIKWITFVVGFLIWLQWEIREAREDSGMFAGLHILATVPVLMLGLIIWLVTFYVIL